jgi:hypothetical protein
MADKNSQKFPKFFTCNFCDYITSHKNDYKKHLQSKKHDAYNDAYKNSQKCKFCNRDYKHRQSLYRHQKNCDQTQKLPLNDNGQKMSFLCDCGNHYLYKSGLTRHKKVCKLNNQIIYKEEPTNWKEMFIELMKKNTEILEEVKEIAKEPKIINNTTNNTNNTQFNIMNYLNNECKDAMNLSDFINELPFSLDDLEIMGTKGYQQSMEDTFIKQLQIMDKTKRPIHCSDKKRKSFYIKENDIWEKDENNSKIVNGLKKISQKHIKILNSWTHYNKNWSYNERKQDFFNKSVQEVAKYNDSKQINKLICKLTGLTVK